MRFDWIKHQYFFMVGVNYSEKVLNFMFGSHSLQIRWDKF